MNTIRIIPIPITHKNFSACGQLITPPPKEPDVQKEGISFWDQVVTCSIEGKPDIGFLALKKRALRVSEMERHITHTQGFIPLNGAKLLLVAAPPSKESKPKLSAIKAYILDGSCGIMIHKGTWHDILYPLDSHARIITILREGTSKDDMLVVDLAECLGANIQVEYGD